MKLRLPVLMQSRQQPTLYSARPLFAPQAWVVESPLLQKVLNLAQQSFRQAVEAAARQPRLDDLARLTFFPELKEHALNLRFEYDRQTVTARLLLVTFPALQRSIAVVPAIPHLWFVLETGDLSAQAHEALRWHLRRLKKSGQELDVERLQATQRSWVHVCELEIAPPGVVAAPSPPSLEALLGCPPRRSASEELAHCGVSLNRRTREHPEEFLGRTDELAELELWAQKSERQALLIVGPRLVGKSALIRAHVARTQPLASRRKKRQTLPSSGAPLRGHPRQFWSLNSGRLIAGMSTLGEWENRLLSILRFCRKLDHVVVVDDLIGWLTAGTSRDSSLTMAQLLKSFLERGDLRVLAEITPEALRVLRERDRALADQFQVLRLQPPTRSVTQRIALAAARAAEDSQGCSFSLESVYRALSLGDRYLTDCSHPGKVPRLLQQVAAHHRQQSITEQELLQWFSAHSGVSLELLDPARPLPSESVMQSLRASMVGQDAAVDCCLEVIHKAKARIQNPQQPLASLLFIGPTGVGKTECARALARSLFGSEERLIRLDMNEFLGSDSVARLIGTFAHPDGMLTEAVRSQPFSVVLLDEVEKADSQVLLLLLQVLGDGRLTDARGRTVDFTQTVIVMTSNLGADQVQRKLGLRTRADQEELTYRRAAEQFFAPELFNRIDRIVAFHRLNRQALSEIADRLWLKVTQREGLLRRQCLLEISPGARKAVVESGFHPLLGARALKRKVEEQVVAPVARLLSGAAPYGLTLIDIDDDLGVTVETLESMAQSQGCWPSRDAASVMADIELFEAELSQGQDPEHSGWISSDDLPPQQLLYYELKEELRRLKAELRPVKSPKRPTSAGLFWLEPGWLPPLVQTTDLLHELRSLLKIGPPPGPLDVALKLHWLKAQFQQPEDSEFEWEIKGSAPTRELAELYRKTFKELDVTLTSRAGRWHMKGPRACHWGPAECGLHLFVAESQLLPVWVDPIHAPRKRRWVRLYAAEGCLDIASGLVSPGIRLSPFLRSR